MNGNISVAEHVVIPMPPTPDAELHLGHATGPYLSADIYTRALRLTGAQVLQVSGIDAFENWCAQLGQSKLDEIFQRHQRALQLLGIEFDAFFSPLSEPFRRTYEITLRETFSAFKEAPGFREREEEVLYDEVSNVYGFGVEISGTCLHCGSAVRGNSCISCFNYLQPTELLNPQMPNHPRAGLKSVRNAFLKLAGIETPVLAGLGLSEEALDRYAAWCMESNGAMRLTYQGNFGVPLSDDPERVIRNSYLQYCAALIRAVRPEVANGRGRVKLSAFMGFDNFIPNGVGSYVLSLGLNWLQLERVELNHMLHFRGEKFSKSKNHGPKILEVLEGAPVYRGSALRVFLAGIDLRRATGQFDWQSFFDFEANYRRIVEKIIREVTPTVLRRAHNNEAVRDSGWWEPLSTVETTFDRPGLARRYREAIEAFDLHPSEGRLTELLIGARVLDPTLVADQKLRLEARS